MLFVMLGVALLGAGLLRLRVHRLLLGIPGAVLGAVFAVGYVTGVFGLRLQEHFGLVGVLLTGMGLWFLVLGVAVIRWSRDDSTVRAGPIAARG